jgi:hypothetical protein
MEVAGLRIILTVAAVQDKAAMKLCFGGKAPQRRS